VHSLAGLGAICLFALLYKPRTCLSLWVADACRPSKREKNARLEIRKLDPLRSEGMPQRPASSHGCSLVDMS